MNKPASIDLDADPAYGFAQDEAGASPGMQPAVARHGLDIPGFSPAPAAKPSTWLDRLNPFQEQQFARRVTREIFELRRRVEQARPGLAGLELLRLVVMVRCKVDPAGAQKLLLEAEESFAAWPTPRELDFADVVHLLAIREYHAQFGRTKWINANMGRIVATELQRLR